MDDYQAALLELTNIGLITLAREGLITMAKDMPASQGETKERAPWQNKPYALKLVKSEEVENRFYRTPEQLDEEYGPRADGEQFWLDEKGNKVWHNSDEMYQFSLTFEVLDGDKKGDWLWVYAPKRFGRKKDGGLFGKRAFIAEAMGKNIDGGLEDDNSDLIGGMLMAVVEPKKPECKYGKALSFYPMDDGDKAKYTMEAAGASVTESKKPKEEDDDIPFHHMPYDALGTTRCGHSRW